MNREQAEKAIKDLWPGHDESVERDINWNDIPAAIKDGEENLNGLPVDERANAEKALGILRQHRDFLRTEDDALAVWREVFVGQAIRVDGWGKLAGAASIADEAEAQFRRRFADYLKAKG
jgi:hypothetical protein